MAEPPNPQESARVVPATFARRQDAKAALEDLLDAGFLNVEQEMEGERTDVLVDPAGREAEALAILTAHGGTRVDLGG
jgi:hypothetical protein